MDREEDRDTTVKDRSEIRTQPPKMYAVIMHNDDFTPMEFVVEMLVKYFGKSTEDAVRVMYEVHRSDKGIAGVYTREIAETKVSQVLEESKLGGYPFKLSFEPQAAAN